MNQGQQGATGAVSIQGAIGAVSKQGAVGTVRKRRASGAVPAPSQAVCPANAIATATPSDPGNGEQDKKNELAKPCLVGDTWSVRARREGCDIFLSGYKTSAAAAKELRYRVAYLEKHGKPDGKGPDKTTVGQALQRHALTHLPSLKGAVQEATRINRYLRDARLATIEVRDMSQVSDMEKLPKGSKVGKYYAAWLVAYTPFRVIPPGLGQHRKALMTKTGGSDRARAVIANLKMSKVKHDHLQALVCALEAEGMAKGTIKQEQAVLRRLFYHARSKWYWPRPDTNPACDLKIAGHLVERERVMSLDEQTRLDDALDCCINDLIGPAVQLLTETAMRAEECIDTARWGGVDWDKRVLHLQDAKAGARDVPLSPRAIEILRALGPSADPEEKIFGISYEALRAGWRRACERAGVKNLQLRDLRHTGATRMALKSGNIFLVQALTGHKTLAMVKRYVNVKACDVVAVMHSPQPAPQAPVQPAAAPVAMSQETLQAAMQMLQAAAAQFSVQAPAAAPGPAHVPEGQAANDDGAVSSFA